MPHARFTTHRSTTIATTHLATRVYGGLTATYGAYALARPEHLARQTGIDPATARTLGRLFGVRDIVSGLSLLVADSPRARIRALRLRVALDTADAVGFAGLAPLPSGRTRGAVAGGTWAVIALALLGAHARTGSADR